VIGRLNSTLMANALDTFANDENALP